MITTPNLYGIIKVAGGLPDSVSPGAVGMRMAQSNLPPASEAPVYKAPEGGSLPDRVFGAMRRGDIATARSLVPHVFEGRSTSSSRTGRSSAAPAASGSALTLGGAMPTFAANVGTSPQGSIPSPEQHRAAQRAAGLDENGMPISLDSPEDIAASNKLLRQMQAGNAAPASAKPAKPARPSRPTASNRHAFRNITAADMRRYRRYTGASDMKSEMDKWKTWQAMQGNRNASNADFYAARSRGFR